LTNTLIVSIAWPVMRSIHSKYTQSRSLIAALCLIFPLLSSCGEETTPRDLNRIQNREDLNQRYKELQPLVGEYEGTLYEVDSDRTSPFRLVLSLSGVSYPQKDLPGETTAPSLAASAYYFTLDTLSSSYVTLPFNHSDFDPSTDYIQFFGENPKGSLSADISEDRTTLKGEWRNIARGLIGFFNVSKK
jgi:hypothetical protein